VIEIGGQVVEASKTAKIVRVRGIEPERSVAADGGAGAQQRGELAGSRYQ
jgi:hypothetical protein